MGFVALISSSPSASQGAFKYHLSPTGGSGRGNASLCLPLLLPPLSFFGCCCCCCLIASNGLDSLVCIRGLVLFSLIDHTAIEKKKKAVLCPFPPASLLASNGHKISWFYVFCCIVVRSLKKRLTSKICTFCPVSSDLKAFFSSLVCFGSYSHQQLLHPFSVAVMIH